MITVFKTLNCKIETKIKFTSEKYTNRMVFFSRVMVIFFYSDSFFCRLKNKQQEKIYTFWLLNYGHFWNIERLQCRVARRLRMFVAFFWFDTFFCLFRYFRIFHLFVPFSVETSSFFVDYYFKKHFYEKPKLFCFIFHLIRLHLMWYNNCIFFLWVYKKTTAIDESNTEYPVFSFTTIVVRRASVTGKYIYTKRINQSKRNVVINTELFFCMVFLLHHKFKRRVSHKNRFRMHTEKKWIGHHWCAV